MLHRTYDIDQDQDCRRYRFKGDSNRSDDPYLARDADVKWVFVEMLYES